jgi:hypothetical protein
MAPVPDDLVPKVLRAYADLCSTSTDSSNMVTAPFSELEVFPTVGGSDGSAGLLGPTAGLDLSPFLAESAPLPEHLPVRSTPATEQLAKLDALHADEVLLRHSWVLVVGTIDVDGVPRQVMQPLLSRPVRLQRRSVLRRVAAAMGDTADAAPFALRYLGDAQMTHWIADPDRRAELLNGAAFGRGSLRLTTSEALIRRMPELSGWIRSSALAAGWPVTRILAPTEHPVQLIRRPGLVAIPAHSLHTVRHVSITSLRTTLLGWARRDGIRATALAEALARRSGDGTGRSGEEGDGGGIADATVDSPMLLSPSQRAVVVRARSAPLTVVSGAPGSGKTHTLCAVAEDTVARGGSVLIATQSRYAADVVTELLDRTPGPTPVRFGDGAGMAGLIDELAERGTHPVGRSEVQRLESELALAETEVEALQRSVELELQLELDAQDAPRWERSLPALIEAAPMAFDTSSDLDELDRLLEAATPRTDDGWWRRLRRRRRSAALRDATGSPADAELERLGLALRAARAGRASATLASRGGTHIGHRWDELASAGERHREALGRRRQLAPFEATVLDDRARAALGDLLVALRAGRGRRRELLAAMQPRHLTAAAPLWVGTLADIEDVLPAAPSLFDLVILDEASQIDQQRAAPALLRARRAVVVGDPHQLRHVSFRSDEDVERALAAHGLLDRRGQLDVRRSSAFDLAASAAPVDQLREHFRSVPHLIEFSVRTFYRDRVQVMTRHPRNEQLDAIDVVRVEAPDGPEKVHRNEVRRVVALIRSLEEQGVTGIGVVTPFRDQADALEQALLAEFDAAELAGLDLRVGTVHAFQGGERDTVIVSLGVGPQDPPGRRRFAEQPDLFNVMITRARQKMIVVTSLDSTGNGRIAAYLRHAAAPLPPATSIDALAPAAAVAAWRDALAEELARFHPVRVDFPVGPWALDLCIGEGDDARLLECGVHPDGVAAHVERRLTLMGLGWEVLDAFPSRWEHQAARAALELR